MSISFEQELKIFFDNYGIDYRDNTGSTELPDFNFKYKDNVIFHFDAKEKLQHYNMSSWSCGLSEQDCFIMDELGIRKVLYFTPNCGILVRNNLLNEYVFFSAVDLFCMPKTRANRKVDYYEKVLLKGKWLINLNNGSKYQTLLEAFAGIKEYKDSIKKIFFNESKCYGNYANERVQIKGIPRGEEYREFDYSITR